MRHHLAKLKSIQRENVAIKTKLGKRELLGLTVYINLFLFAPVRLILVLGKTNSLSQCISSFIAPVS